MSSTNDNVQVNLEFTPNPNTLKYSVNREFLNKGTLNITSQQDAKKNSPLATQLFSLAGIAGVMIGKNFITVTKSEDGDWDIVHKYASALIEKFLQEGHPVFSEEFLNKTKTEAVSPQSSNEIERKIREILDNEIRPAVAMDGGDITFDRFEDGIVYLYMQGSCSGCPSSTATLKMGIETRLRDAIPEVIEVVSV